MGDELTYAQDIRPLFRDRDVRSMTFAFDLSSYEDVRTNAEGSTRGSPLADRGRRAVPDLDRQRLAAVDQKASTAPEEH